MFVLCIPCRTCRRAEAMKEMEEHESSDANSSNSGLRNSAYDYEDLPSNLLGIYFQEVYLESDDAKGKDYTTNLKEYLEKIGVTDPDKAPNYKSIPETNDDETGEINPTYEPKYTTKSRDSQLDKDIIKFKDEFIRNSGNTFSDRRSDKDKKKMEKEAKSKGEFIGIR